MADPNVELLTAVAIALGDLRDQMVFVGGCATALLITDPAAAPVRATHDVDAIVAIASLSEYLRLGGALRARGFVQTVEEGEPPYRWTHSGMKLDLMPANPAVLGFSNRWYETALKSATARTLKQSVEIRLVAPACFVATKLEAFLDRGQGDYLSSSDLEDVLCVVDGRPELAEELLAADAELCAYVAGALARLLADEGFLNALPGLILEGSPAERTPVVLQRLRDIASMQG